MQLHSYLLFSCRANLLHIRQKRRVGTIYRIRLHLDGQDPCEILREQTDLTDDGLEGGYRLSPRGWEVRDHLDST